MEKHKCKLCFRNFSNGRALGGHMRSHMVNLPVSPKPEPPLAQLSFEADSSPSSSSSSSSDEEEDDDKALCYGLRENPKRSFRLVDPDFSFPVESASVILQDRESETESSKNPTGTRSDMEFNNNNQFHHLQKKMKPSNDHHHHNFHHHKNKTESSSWVEPEPVSSISDATTEEDVAFCLMMLSRDEWKRQEEKDDEEEDDEEEEEEEDEEEEDDDRERSVEDSDEFYEEMKSSKARSVRGRYKCETCKRVFRSYQALGGHRASHKKIKAVVICETDNNAPAMAAAVAEKKIHECPVCFRVFASGQALGGHKRTHVIGSATSVVRSSTPSTTTTKFGDNNNNNNSLIDLNLPAPVDEEDEISQIENSAVSDSEFFKPSSQIIEAQV
ncbi:hypothetical protein K1719_018011 [Acacia pycnantha]|nr:hypothetical protein K1719_018011 [Acacia pycnantha]